MAVVLIALATVLITLISTNFKSILAFANGRTSFKEELGYFSVGFWDRIVVFALVGATIAAPILLQNKLSITHANFKVAERQAEQNQEYLDRLELSAQRAVGANIAKAADRLNALWERLRDARSNNTDNRVSDKIETVARDLDAVARTAIGSKYKAVIGSQKTRLGPVSVNARRAHIFNTETGAEEMVIVVHIFEDVAYWEYKQANVFVGEDDESDVNLWRVLQSEDAVAKFGEFDLVAGLGLESRSGEVSDGLSGRRAETLCTNLEVMLANDTDTDAVGLDIGVYRGAAFESIEAKDPKLRPVIIVGVKARHDANYDMFVAELLSKVKIKGLDLGMFEKLMPDDNPDWYHSPDCHPQFAFINPKEGD